MVTPMESGNSTVDKAGQFALRYLSYRPRSRQEMVLCLKPRFGQDIALAVVDQLSRDGLVNDEDFSSFWRESRERIRPRSGSLVQQELLFKGVSPEVAARAGAQVDDEKAALAAGRQHIRRFRAGDFVTFERKLASHLGRRGFPDEVVRRTVRRLWKGILGDE